MNIFHQLARSGTYGHSPLFFLFQSAVCGSIAGGFAAGATTPLDLAKTRIMLAPAGRGARVGPTLGAIYCAGGLRALFAGALPRTSAFMLGGFVFFGVYEDTKTFFERHINR